MIRLGKNRIVLLPAALRQLMMMALVLIPGMAWGASDTPATATAEPLVIVGDDTISTRDMDEALVETHSKMSADEKLDFDYRKLLNKLVNDRLLMQEARAMGMDEEPSLLGRLDTMRTRNAIRRFVADRYKPDLAVTENEIREYFQAYYSRLQLRTMAVQTQSEAEQIAAAIRGGASMDSIAQTVSLDMYRYKGGIHNDKYYGDVERELRDRADRLKPGELSDPFPYRQVWALVRLERRSFADTSEMDAQRPKIERVLREEKHARQWMTFLDSLTAQAGIIEDTAAMASIRADAANLFTPGFMQGTERPVYRSDEGLEITDASLRRAVSHTAMSMRTAPFDSILAATREEMLQEMTLAWAATRAGYRDRQDVIEACRHSLDSALVEVYLQQTVAPQIVFNHEEFEAYYQEHIDEFRRPTTCQFDRMTIDSEQTARDIAARLADGGDFYFVGRQFKVRLSTSEESAEWLNLQAFPDTVRQEIEALSIGASTAPYRTTEGWLILRLKGRKPGEPRPLADVEMRIREVMFQKKFSETLDGILKALKENAAIEYKQEAIDKYFGAGS